MRNGTISFSSTAIAGFSGSDLQRELKSQPSFHVTKAMCQASEIIPKNATRGIDGRTDSVHDNIFSAVQLIRASNGKLHTYP